MREALTAELQVGYKMVSILSSEFMKVGERKGMIAFSMVHFMLCTLQPSPVIFLHLISCDRLSVYWPSSIQIWCRWPRVRQRRAAAVSASLYKRACR